MATNFSNALGLDVGLARIGVARINSVARIAEPLIVLKNDHDFRPNIERLCVEYDIDLIVVGVPRNMSGEKTKQSQDIEQFAASMREWCDVSIILNDETLSTVTAGERISAKNASLEDAVAACVILEDFIATNH